MNNRFAGELMDKLQRLLDAGIQVHTQIVCCPTYNDGEVLAKSFEDLYALHPGVLTMAQSTRRGSFSVHRSEKTPGSKSSSTSGLSPRGHLERQAEVKVQSLVGELRSHMPHGQKNKT